jgi:hypothetical protein
MGAASSAARGLAMRRLLWIGVVGVAACASGRGGTAAAGTGVGLGGPGPFLFHRVQDVDSPHPTIRISSDTAEAEGIHAPTFASPELVDRLAASCPESNEPVDCRRTAMLCREKLCRVVPELP